MAAISKPEGMKREKKLPDVVSFFMALARRSSSLNDDDVTHAH